MADKNMMTPSISSYSELLGNGVTYYVPIFQRDYSWEYDNWADLWEDILNVGKSDKAHFMGAVVLQNLKDKKYIVIDGQQRFTTLSIIALAVIRTIEDLINKGIEPADNSERIIELRRSFLGQKDPSSLNYSSKLFLNENNDQFYQRNLLQLAEPLNKRHLSESDRLLWNSFEFFYDKISTEFCDASGADLALFLSKTVGDKIMFIKIEVEDELSAYTLFETLNYRGVELTVTDLLKNYLFSLISPSDLRIAKDIWKKVTSGVGFEKFPVFLRHFWISKMPMIRQDQLFQAIKNEVKTNEQVFELLNSLDKYSDIYIALQDPYNLQWRGNRKRMKLIRELKLFAIAHHLPLLMLAKDKFSEIEFDKLLKIISVIIFRLSVVGLKSTNRMEFLFNAAAQDVFYGYATKANEIFNKIKEIYVSDADFKSDFSTLELLTYGERKKLVRYILFELENNLMQGGDRDYELDSATIEHILPENPTDEWEEFFRLQEQESYIYRLGNYTLLEDNLNKKCETSLFGKKKEYYSKSQYEMTKNIEYNEWNPATIEARQIEFAKRAVTIWKVDSK